MRLILASHWRLSLLYLPLLCLLLSPTGFFPVNQGLRICLVWDAGAMVTCGPQPHADRTGALAIPEWHGALVTILLVVCERSGDVFCVNRGCRLAEQLLSHAHFATHQRLILPKATAIQSNARRCPCCPTLHQDFDQSIVIFRLDLKPGDVVIESGTGSGVMSSVSTTTGHRVCIFLYM